MQKIIYRWEVDGSSSSSSSDSEKEKEKQRKKQEEFNDFRVDRERIKAAHSYEEKNERLVFDPDQDGFNFGYEMALTFKVRYNMFRLIRKEIVANSWKFWDDNVDDLALKFNKPEMKA